AFTMAYSLFPLAFRRLAGFFRSEILLGTGRFAKRRESAYLPARLPAHLLARLPAHDLKKTSFRRLCRTYRTAGKSLSAETTYDDLACKINIVGWIHICPAFDHLKMQMGRLQRLKEPGRAHTADDL